MGAKNGNGRDAAIKKAGSVATGLKVPYGQPTRVGSRPVHHGDVTRIYLSEIGRSRLLTADEEKSLTRAARKE